MENLKSIINNSLVNLNTANVFEITSDIKTKARLFKTGLGILNWGSCGSTIFWRKVVYSHQKMDSKKTAKIVSAIVLTPVPIFLGFFPSVILGAIGGLINACSNEKTLKNDIICWLTREEIKTLCQTLFNTHLENGDINPNCIFECIAGTNQWFFKEYVIENRAEIRQLFEQIVLIVSSHNMCPHRHLLAINTVLSGLFSEDKARTFQHNIKGGQFYESFADRHPWMIVNTSP